MIAWKSYEFNNNYSLVKMIRLVAYSTYVNPRRIRLLVCTTRKK